MRIALTTAAFLLLMLSGDVWSQQQTRMAASDFDTRTSGQEVGSLGGFVQKKGPA